MKNNNEDNARMTRWIGRAARIWSGPIILFAALMLLGYAWNWITLGTTDPYVVEGTTFVEALPPILMFISILGLALAWRWERWGGLMAVAFQAATIVVLIIQGPGTREFNRAVLIFCQLWS